MNRIAEDNHEERRRVKTKSHPSADGLRRQNFGAPSSGHGCRTSSLLERRIARDEREVHQELAAALR